MELEKQIQEARTQFEQNLTNPNTEIVAHSNPEEMASVVESIGQRNNTALGDGEVAEFFPMEDYKNDIQNKIIHTQTTSNTTGRTFDNLYAAVKRYFLVNGKKVGEHIAFINVGNMVRRHFDLGGKTPNAEGKIEGAVRVVTPGTFNEKLSSYKLPWAMLEQCLAGKKVVASRSNDKLFFQKFVGNQPVPNEYVEQNYMVYNYAK